jgi:hypothetical protein
MKRITKEFQYIDKHTPFRKLMQGNEFASLDKETLELLSKGEHPDKNLQERFTLMKGLFDRVTQLNFRYWALKRPEAHPSSPEDLVRPKTVSL